MGAVSCLKWLAPVITALSYAVWQFHARQVYAAHLPPFDLRLYNLADARTYMAALSPEAIATYIGPLHSADLALLTSLTSTLVLTVWRNGWIWLLPALCYAGFDFAENTAVAALLTHGLRQAGDVAVIAALTAFKFTSLALAVLLALASLWRHRSTRP